MHGCSRHQQHHEELAESFPTVCGWPPGDNGVQTSVWSAPIPERKWNFPDMPLGWTTKLTPSAGRSVLRSG